MVWYQGESNAGNCKEYQTLFPALIADWREKWCQGDFPFLFVQIAPFKRMSPEIRESQFLTLSKSANTAMAVTADIGDANDIHPKRKEPVGARLALAARALAYGEKIEYSGPLFATMKIDGPRATVAFQHTGSSWGRRHPYMLVGGLLMALCSYLIWTLPGFCRGSQISFFMNLDLTVKCFTA